MNINETHKRIGRGINKTYYHYMVYNSDNELNTYYRTTKEIAQEFGCSRGTIYSIITNPDKPRRIYKNLKIEQDYKHTDLVNYIKEQNDLISCI
jgi:predicted DNA-binding protein YlxM (UPF0122 family)